MSARYLKLLASIMLIVSVGIAPACSRRQNREEDTLLKAYRLIDSHRTDEAVDLLESHLAKDPENYRVKVVLASAYAHKAGIRIQNLVPVVLQSQNFKKSSNVGPIKADTKNGVNGEVNTAVRRLASLLVRWASFLQQYAAIPVLTAEKATYLRHAIYLLNELGERLKPGDIFYRAILEIVLFKEIAADKLVGEVRQELRQKGSRCQIGWDRVTDGVSELGKLLIDIFNDLGMANPNQAKEMSLLSQEISDHVSNLATALTTASAWNEAGQLLLSQIAVDVGFGKLLQCDGR